MTSRPDYCIAGVASCNRVTAPVENYLAYNVGLDLGSFAKASPRVHPLGFRRCPACLALIVGNPHQLQHGAVMKQVLAASRLPVLVQLPDPSAR